MCVCESKRKDEAADEEVPLTRALKLVLHVRHLKPIFDARKIPPQVNPPPCTWSVTHTQRLNHPPFPPLLSTTYRAIRWWYISIATDRLKDIAVVDPYIYTLDTYLVYTSKYCRYIPGTWYSPREGYGGGVDSGVNKYTRLVKDRVAVDPPGVESNREMLDAKGNQRAVDGTTSQVYIYIYICIYIICIYKVEISVAINRGVTVRTWRSAAFVFLALKPRDSNKNNGW